MFAALKLSSRRTKSGVRGSDCFSHRPHADHQYTTHWTERPAVAHAEVARIRGEFRAVHPTMDLKALTNADMPTVKAFFDAPLPQHYPAWQVETVREIRALLAAAMAVA